MTNRPHVIQPLLTYVQGSISGTSDVLISLYTVPAHYKLRATRMTIYSSSVQDTPVKEKGTGGDLSNVGYSHDDSLIFDMDFVLLKNDIMDTLADRYICEKGDVAPFSRMKLSNTFHAAETWAFPFEFDEGDILRIWVKRTTAMGAAPSYAIPITIRLEGELVLKVSI